MESGTLLMTQWATVILTFALVLISAFYAYANYATMRIMEADVRSRTQPLPIANITVARLGASSDWMVTGEISTSNAPMLISAVYVSLYFNDRKLR
jgi:hypothetical protein